jgi:ribosome-binding factor A
MMSTRTEKIASVIHHAVQEVMTRGLNDPRVRGLVSITRVEVAPDLADARIFVSVLPAERGELTLRGLSDAAGYIQREAAPAVSARRMPRLHFRLDDSLKKQASLDAAITSLQGDAGDRPDGSATRAGRLQDTHIKSEDRRP